MHPLLAPRRQPGQQAGGERAADAVADDVGVLFARLFADDVQRRQRALAHVVLEGDLAQRLVGIVPGDQEDGQPLFRRPAHEAVLRAHVKDVVLVDPGRHDQQRAPVLRLGPGRVLDQLHQAVAEDHLARRGGEIAAELEQLVAGGADLQPTAAALEVLEEIQEPPAQARPLRLPCAPQHHGIGGREVGRADGVQMEPEIEVELVAAVGIEAVHRAVELAEAPHRGGVGLADGVEGGILLPGRIGETPVALFGQRHRLRRVAARTQRRGLPDLREVEKPRLLHRRHVRRLRRQQLGVGGREDAGHVDGIGDADLGIDGQSLRHHPQHRSRAPPELLEFACGLGVLFRCGLRTQARFRRPQLRRGGLRARHPRRFLRRLHGRVRRRLLVHRTASPTAAPSAPVVRAQGAGCKAGAARRPRRRLQSRRKLRST
ncbi:hypothetical protein HRbin39_01317 [bacterium HR39]|nr:hypothetical protein HRbin39_01317 [bacterium HR39]